MSRTWARSLLSAKRMDGSVHVFRARYRFVSPSLLALCIFVSQAGRVLQRASKDDVTIDVNTSMLRLLTSHLPLGHVSWARPSTLDWVLRASRQAGHRSLSHSSSR